MDLIRQKTFSFLIKEEIMNKKYTKEDQKTLLFGFSLVVILIMKTFM